MKTTWLNYMHNKLKIREIYYIETAIYLLTALTNIFQNQEKVYLSNYP